MFGLIGELRAPFGDRVAVGMPGRGFRPEIGRQGLLETGARRQLVRGFTSRWTKCMYVRSREIAPVGLLQAQAKSRAGVFQRKGTYRPQPYALVTSRHCGNRNLRGVFPGYSADTARFRGLLGT